MSKWSGIIGYSFTIEDPLNSGVFREVFEERIYYGDLLSNTRRIQNTNQVNDDIFVSNQLSIVADPYAFSNMHNIKYATFKNTKWKVSSIEDQYPRLILNLSGVYNNDGGPIFNG